MIDTEEVFVVWRRIHFGTWLRRCVWKITATQRDRRHTDYCNITSKRNSHNLLAVSCAYNLKQQLFSTFTIEQSWTNFICNRHQTQVGVGPPWQKSAYDELRPKVLCVFSALMLLVGWQEGHGLYKTEWWGAGMVIHLERGADLLMPLPVTVTCFSKIQTGFTFLVPARPGSPGQMAVERVSVYMTYWWPFITINLYSRTLPIATNFITDLRKQYSQTPV